MYNLEISQLINAEFGCSEFRMRDQLGNDVSQDFKLSLDMILPTQ